MSNLHQELTTHANLLELIDRRRLETGNPGLGAAIERAIVGECLAQLEDVRATHCSSSWSDLS